jgi:hypothetical protein
MNSETVTTNISIKPFLKKGPVIAIAIYYHADDLWSKCFYSKEEIDAAVNEEDPDIEDNKFYIVYGENLTYGGHT